MIEKRLKFPCFYASISSVKTKQPVEDYFSYLNYVDYPYILVSAYDLHSLEHQQGNEIIITNPKSRSNCILLDSGGYEAYWLRDETWNIENYNEILKKNLPDYYFSFDFKCDSEQGLKNTHYCSNGEIIPIIHMKSEDYWKNIQSSIVDEDYPFLALPERELGPDIASRAYALKLIQTQIEQNDIPVNIHLLGTGDPLSLLLYSALGVRSFDGLEWCKSVVDPNTNCLMHFTQRELFECNCQVCQTDNEMSYIEKTLSHNILFYLDWMAKIQHYLYRGKISEILNDNFNENFLKKIGMVN